MITKKKKTAKETKSEYFLNYLFYLFKFFSLS